MWPLCLYAVLYLFVMNKEFKTYSNSAPLDHIVTDLIKWNIKIMCLCDYLQIQSVSQELGTPSVSLVYVVKNQDAILNGTISSGLLNQLTAELVGYFLFYPPLVIAERK